MSTCFNHKIFINYYCYADDTQLYTSFTPGEDELLAVERLQSCIKALRTWMYQNKLKLNDGKTEFIVFGTPAGLRKVITSTLLVGNQLIPASSSVRNIGAYFDQNLKMDTQVKLTCKSAWFHLYNISRIRSFLTSDQAKSVIHAYVTSKLDFNNVLLTGVPQYLTSKQ